MLEKILMEVYEVSKQDDIHLYHQLPWDPSDLSSFLCSEKAWSGFNQVPDQFEVIKTWCCHSSDPAELKVALATKRWNSFINHCADLMEVINQRQKPLFPLYLSCKIAFCLLFHKLKLSIKSNRRSGRRSQSLDMTSKTGLFFFSSPQYFHCCCFPPFLVYCPCG